MELGPKKTDIGIIRWNNELCLAATIVKERVRIVRLMSSGCFAWNEDLVKGITLLHWV